MSNFLAIATVTATLQRTLQAAIQTDVYGSRVTTVRPVNLGNGPSECGLNIFLYQVISNPALTNIDVTPFRTKGNPTKRQAALDLYYMLSFYGNETELEPQRILGSVVRTLNDRAIMKSDLIRETLNDPNYTFLRDSDLPDYVQQINIMPVDLNLEDLSKAWSAFFQTPYILSIVYKVMVVLVEGKDPAQRSLPVRRPNLGGMVAFPTQPIVEQVICQAGTLEPILVNSNLLIQGKNLKSNVTKVRIGGVDVNPTEVSDQQIILSLANVPIDVLRAGVQSLQVIHQIPTGIEANRNNSNPLERLMHRTTTQPPSYRNIESNVAPFVLRPTIVDVSLINVEENLDGSRFAEIRVQANLTVGERQRVVVALNEWSVEEPASYLFDAAKRQGDTNFITVPIEKIKAGDYLVRLMIDGAESQLDIDMNPESTTFNWYIGPKVLIS